ncbi:hypothetical protein MMC18_009485 [Xylographa bjoerkii]|nr:hypothetical protein [Xylographa bjoerkii]
MSDPNEPRKRSPSLGQKIISKVKKTVRSLSGNSEKKPKVDQEKPTEALAERLHREKLERDKAERNRARSMESFLQSGRNGPRIVQTHNGPRAVQEPTRAPSPQRTRLERETARRPAASQSMSPPRGRSPTHRGPRISTTARPSTPLQQRRTVTRAASRPGANVRLNSEPRGASSFKPGSSPRHGPSPLAAVSAPSRSHRVDPPTQESSRSGTRYAFNPSHLHPDRFTAEAWPAPNTGVYGPHIIPGAGAPASNTGAHAFPGVPNIAAEGLHGIPGLPTTRKPIPAVIKQTAAPGDLRGPGIPGSRLIEPGLEVQPVSARGSLVNPTPPPEDLGPESPEISPLTKSTERSSGETHISHLDLEYTRIVADHPPVLRTPTVLRHDSRQNRFSGQALADMHVNLCKNCNNRPRSANSRDFCHSCENLLLCPGCHEHHLDSVDARLCKSCGRTAITEIPQVSPISPQHYVPQNSPVSPVSPAHDIYQGFPLCPHCRKNPVDIPSARLCRACERQLGYEYVSHAPRRRSSEGDDNSPSIERPSSSPYTPTRRPAMADRAHTATHDRTATRTNNTTRSRAGTRHNIGDHHPHAVRPRATPLSTLDGPFSPGIPIHTPGPVSMQQPRHRFPSPPTPPLKDSPRLRRNPQLTTRYRQNATVPFPRPAAPTPPSPPRAPRPSSGNLSLSAFPPPLPCLTQASAPQPTGFPALPPVRGAGTPFEVRGSKPAFRKFAGSKMNESDGEFQRLIDAQWRLQGTDASPEDVQRAVEEMKRAPKGEVETQRAKVVWDDEWLTPDTHERPREAGR